MLLLEAKAIWLGACVEVTAVGSVSAFSWKHGHAKLVLGTSHSMWCLTETKSYQQIGQGLIY